VGRRRFEMEDGVKDELQLGTASAQNGIKSCVDLAESGLGLFLDEPHRHQKRAGQGNGRRGDGRGQRVLSQAFCGEMDQCHALTPGNPARLICESSITEASPARASRSWLTRNKAALF